jgi:L-threonylcarbamoyladenylate synthase
MTIDIIEKAIVALKEGKIILYPTDTIWGIGCDATNEQAVQRLIAFKGKAQGRGLITLVDKIELLHEYVEYVSPRIDALIVHHIKPLTVIYNHPKGFAKSVLNEDGSVAIRVTKDPFCMSLIEHLGKPIVSTSANIHGQPFPANFGEISSDILEKVDHTVMIRHNDKKQNQPSVIIKLDEKEEIIFLRE